MEDARISHVRFQVLAFVVALAAVTYLDRVCIAQTADDMMRDLNLTKEQISAQGPTWRAA
jgi:hypothetical protein